MPVWVKLCESRYYLNAVVFKNIFLYFSEDPFTNINKSIPISPSLPQPPELRWCQLSVVLRKERREAWVIQKLIQGSE